MQRVACSQVLMQRVACSQVLMQMVVCSQALFAHSLACHPYTIYTSNILCNSECDI